MREVMGRQAGRCGWTPTASTGSKLRRKCACGGTPGPDGECAACKAKRLRREAANRRSRGAVPESVRETLRAPGQSLPGPVAAEMGEKLGHDFSQVRIHTDARAAASAEAVGALAYAVGRNVVFGAGQFAPQTAAGRRVLAHELAHVAQSGGRPASPESVTLGSPGSRHEREADTAAKLATAPGAGARDAGGVPTLSAAPAPLLQRIGPGAASATVGGAAVASSVSSEGHGAGGGGAPAGGTSGACKIEVGATHIGGILSGFPIWHLLVIYTDSAGDEYYYRGGPGGSCPGVAAGGYGTIISTSGRYLPGTVDYPASHRTTVLTGTSACGKDSCFASELSRIDSRCVPYAPTGPNSNTVARTLLANCGVPQRKPVAIAPGWGDPVL